MNFLSSSQYPTIWTFFFFFSSRRRHTRLDRKSTRLNSSHSQISYAVFCLKKKTNIVCRLLLEKKYAIHPHLNQHRAIGGPSSVRLHHFTDMPRTHHHQQSPLT